MNFFGVEATNQDDAPYAEAVRAHVGNLSGDVQIHAVDDRHHRDERGGCQNDPEQRQESSSLLARRELSATAAASANDAWDVISSKRNELIRPAVPDLFDPTENHPVDPEPGSPLGEESEMTSMFGSDEADVRILRIAGSS